MKKIYSIIILLMFVTSTINAQVTYTWNVAGGGSWATTTNWTPTRTTPATSDILQFNTNITATITAVPTQAIGRLLITGGADITLSGGGGAQTLTIGNGTGDDLVIASGSSLIQNSTLETVTIAASSTGDISGDYTVNGIFNTDGTSVVTTVTGTITNIGTVTCTTLTKLLMQSGSTYTHSRDAGTIPTATWNATSTCSITGLTSNYPGGTGQSFGNLTFNSTLAGNNTMSADITCVNLTISNGGSPNVIRGTNTATNRSITVSGNFSLTNGYFVLTSDNGDVTMNVTGNFSVSGGTFDFNNDNGTGDATLNVTGNYSHTAGTITRSDLTGTGTAGIVFNGSSAQLYTSGGTVGNGVNYTVNSGSTLQMAVAGTTVDGAGTFTLSSGAALGITSTAGITAAVATATGNIRTTTGRVFDPGATYIYNNGAAGQSTGTGLPTNLTGTFRINNSGNTVTLSNAEAIASGGTVDIVAGTFAAGTNLTMLSTSSITRSGGTMTGTPQGAGVYNVTYTGNSMSTTTELTGTGLNNLTLNLSASQTLTLAASRSVPGTLTLTAGILNIGVNTITLTNATDGSQLSGGSASSYVVATGAGRLRRNAISGAQAFPVGTATTYLPATVNPLSSSDFSVNVFSGATTNGVEGGPAMSPTGIVNAIWNVDRPSGSGNADITLNWNSGAPAIEGASFSNFPDALVGISKYSGSWQNGIGSGNNTTNTATATFSTFSPFGVGAKGFPLPVKISNIKAAEKLQGVQIDWTTYSEENLSKYQVERSADGVRFASIGEVAARNITTASNYGFFDASPLRGVNFYRLRSVDMDGQFAYSSIVKVNLDKGNKEITIYPNPATAGYVSLQSADLAKGNYTVNILSAIGQQVYSQRFTHNGGAVNQTIQLPNGVKSGMYSIQLNSDDIKVMSKTFMVQ